ncbi:MAG: hypothetical protein SGJ20_09770 [Planctomycetota bacterium]|nr:hypothetical protein [Planctomycetota bacterium]
MKAPRNKSESQSRDWNEHEHVADPVNVEAQRSESTGESSSEDLVQAAGNEELAKQAKETVRRQRAEKKSPNHDRNNVSQSSKDPVSKSLRRPKAEE